MQDICKQFQKYDERLLSKLHTFVVGHEVACIIRDDLLFPISNASSWISGPLSAELEVKTKL